MKRRILLWGLLLVALPLSLWGVVKFLDGRPNPILVTVGPGTSGSPVFQEVVVTTSNPRVAVVEVEVARARPIRMKVSDELARGTKGATFTMPFADSDAVEAEERELRGALDAWLAVPGRNLKVAGTWVGTELRTVLFGIKSQRVRVVLTAQLVPVPAAEK